QSGACQRLSVYLRWWYALFQQRAGRISSEDLHLWRGRDWRLHGRVPEGRRRGRIGDRAWRAARGHPRERAQALDRRQGTRGAHAGRGERGGAWAAGLCDRRAEIAPGLGGRGTHAAAARTGYGRGDRSERNSLVVLLWR